MTPGSRLGCTASSVERAQSQPSEVECGGSSCVRCGDEYSAKRKVSVWGDVGAAPSVCADSEMCDRRISQLRPRTDGHRVITCRHVPALRERLCSVVTSAPWLI
jgi:hypothetical protein